MFDQPMKSLLGYSQSGNLLILSMLVLTLIMINTVVLIGGALDLRQGTNYSLRDVQAISLAEAGIDKAVAALNNTAGAYTGEAETSLGEGTFEVSVASVDANNKNITATGYIPNKANPQVTRTVKMQVVKGSGTNFSYAVQVGQGGFEMQQGATINGSVYSNGNITMAGGARVTGNVYVAGGTQADQANSCYDPNCLDYTFGRTVSGQTILDVAQSFQPQVSGPLTKVVVKVKRYNWAPDLSVKILGDNNGSPNKNNVLASGSITTSTADVGYGYLDVNLTTAPTLLANTPYWIMLHASNNSYAYWAWSQDSLGSYTRGNAKWSSDWQAASPVWNNVSGDFDFQTYVGGLPSSITTTGGPQINGDAHANTLQNNSGTFNIGQHAYYQTASNITVHGQSCANNAYCHPNSPDPIQRPLPISDANIQTWKDAATAAGVYTGNINGCQANFPAGKYVGNVVLNGGCNATMTDPVWITGTFTITGGATLRLNSSYGGASGVLIVDGPISFQQGGQVRGSGTANSYLTAISTYNSQSNGIPAIDLSGGSNSSIIYAGNGIINMTGGANLRELTAWKVIMTGGSSLTYDTGLADITYLTGPSGSYTPVKGTYVVK